MNVFGGTWNQPVCPFVCVSVSKSICMSVCVLNTRFCQVADGGIKSHIVTALVSTMFLFFLNHSGQIIAFEQILINS